MLKNKSDLLLIFLVYVVNIYYICDDKGVLNPPPNSGKLLIIKELGCYYGDFYPKRIVEGGGEYLLFGWFL